MRSCRIRLTDDLVAAAHPAAREYSLRDTKITGLSLRVLPSGVKSWVMRFQDGGRARRVTLGDARHCQSARNIDPLLECTPWVG